MKIDTGLKSPTLPPAVDNRPAQPRSGTRTATEQTDVSLSARAAELKQLETQLAAVPVVNRSRVESIKDAIASGQYVINSENIAAGLLDMAQDTIRVAR